MKKEEFFKEKHVRGFVEWLEHHLEGEMGFVHGYHVKKTRKPWSCTSLYHAYEAYAWPFRHVEEDGTLLRGENLSETRALLQGFRARLKEAVDGEDPDAARRAAISILAWGGVLHGNVQRIEAWGEKAAAELRRIRSRLESDLPLEDYYEPGMSMNSGFTKIYALLARDFIIYDGRVGAALGLLVRRYAEEKRLRQVPEPLSFAWGQGREGKGAGGPNRRDPSKGRFVLKALGNHPRRHLESNIRANWIVEAVLRTTATRFGRLPWEEGFFALESALFMIGYDVRPYKESQSGPTL